MTALASASAVNVRESRQGAREVSSVAGQLTASIPLLEGGGDVALGDGRRPVPTLPDQPCHGSKGHCLAEQQDQRLEPQREAGELPAQGGSTWRFPPSGRRTRGTRTSR